MPEPHPPSERYGCSLPFDNDSHDFVLGAEVGAVFERLLYEEGPVEEVLHVENAEMVLHMAEAARRTVKSEDMGNGRVNARFSEPNRDSGFRTGDRVVVNGHYGTVTEPWLSAGGTIRIKYDGGPLVRSPAALAKWEDPDA